MLNEIFGIYKVRRSDITNATKICLDNDCARIEMYNYVLNQTIVGFVLVKESKVISLVSYDNVQPDLPPGLIDIAVQIAKDNRVVKEELSKYNIDSMPLMAGTKTALNRTNCQRSQHLCVAPTFIKGDKALWVIVDLTELKVAGIKWTNTGSGEYVTERSAQNKKIMDCYCDINNSIEQLGWKLDYSLTRSDGLKVSEIFFQNNKVVKSIKLVDWHVSYSNVDGFGYADAVGCPEFSSAAVLAVEAPRMEWIVKQRDTLGFKLIQEYFSQGWPAPCNYNYYQHIEFYKDGSFRPVAGSVGRGCGSNGIYRPITRISFGNGFQIVEEYKDKKWNNWNKEGWVEQNETSKFGPKNEWIKFKSKKSKKINYIMEANCGQFMDNGRGDNAFVYITNFHDDKDEGESDLPAIGSCCNLDYKQGPEQFIDPEPENIGKNDIVLWYVPKIQNDNTPGKEYCWAEMRIIEGILKPVTFPCLSGPLFKFVKK